MKFKEGDIIGSCGNYYIYLFNKDCSKYMFRRIKPIEAIWFYEEELISFCRWGNLFTDGINFSI